MASAFWPLASWPTRPSRRTGLRRPALAPVLAPKLRLRPAPGHGRPPPPSRRQEIAAQKAAAAKAEKAENPSEQNKDETADNDTAKKGESTYVAAPSSTAALTQADIHPAETAETETTATENVADGRSSRLPRRRPAATEVKPRKSPLRATCKKYVPALGVARHGRLLISNQRLPGSRMHARLHPELGAFLCLSSAHLSDIEVRSRPIISRLSQPGTARARREAPALSPRTEEHRPRQWIANRNEADRKTVESSK